MEVFAHPTNPDYVILHISQCPRMFQRLTCASFGDAMQYEPDSQGFVMSRTTYQTMYKQLAHAASLLDLKKNTVHMDGPILVDTPNITHQGSTKTPQPETASVPRVCTRSIWTQTQTQEQQSNATQTMQMFDGESTMPIRNPTVGQEPDRSMEQLDKVVFDRWSGGLMPHGHGHTTEKSTQSKPQTVHDDNSMYASVHPPIESGLLRTLLPSLGEEAMQRPPNVPIDPYPSSLVDETKQTIFSGCSNFQQLYAHRKEVGLFLLGDR
jgi:hypothetical protein